MNRPLLSVAVPTHKMENGNYFFRRLLDSLWDQSFQDFEIVVSDNSDDGDIQRICEWYRTGIRYVRNPRKGMAPNTNRAIRESRGDFIKFLYMDDFLSHDQALKNIINRFNGHWLVTSCNHCLGEDSERRFDSHHPKWSDDIHLGNNTIGSPSVLTVKTQSAIFFDEKMTWLLDCDYYRRLYDLFGKPTIINDIGVTIGLHEGQATHTMGDERKQQEHEYIREKYAKS